MGPAGIPDQNPRSGGGRSPTIARDRKFNQTGKGHSKVTTTRRTDTIIFYQQVFDLCNFLEKIFHAH